MNVNKQQQQLKAPKGITMADYQKLSAIKYSGGSLKI